MDVSQRILPAHIEETVRSIAKLQSSHQEQASALQRSADKLTAFIGQPKFLLVITATVILWIGISMMLPLFGLSSFDPPPPFNWLQGVLALAALYITAIILSTQRYADLLGGYREQLTLELAILTEQKTSKIIELLEEQRRDNPLIENRFDPQAKEMASAADPELVLDAIKEAYDERTAPAADPKEQEQE